MFEFWGPTRTGINKNLDRFGTYGRVRTSECGPAWKPAWKHIRCSAKFGTQQPNAGSTFFRGIPTAFL
jgi:hypothetical protein